jgi:ADP-heptose:LPS heptosyltransferase
MALPAIEAVADAADRCFVASPPWGRALYRDTGATWVPVGVVPEGVELAVLLAPSFRAAWGVRHLARRLGAASDGRRLLLTDPVPLPPMHRREGYAAVVSALGLEIRGTPAFRARPDEISLTSDLPRHVGLNPVSRSGPPVEWPYFRELAARLGAPLRLYAGPGDEEEACQRVPDVPLLAPAELGTLAACLSHCDLLISNDSGLAHFAAAAGARVLVLHGSTSPARTGVEGASVLEGPDPGCRPCYLKRCPISEGSPPCLAGLTVDCVLEALR